MKTLLSSYLLLILFSCRNREQKITTVIVLSREDSAKLLLNDLLRYDSIMNSLKTNTIHIDTLLNKLIPQEKVKQISVLKESYDSEDHMYSYTDSSYTFRLKVFDNDNPLGRSDKSNTVLYDGKYQIDFDQYKISCVIDSLCQDYGFNWYNYLLEPEIIEVCGYRFLYSELSYWCNGMGCGCNIFMIYDLQNHIPAFIENYRIHFDGYFISDFNSDNNPDLLILQQTWADYMYGFDTKEAHYYLYSYTYDDGKFVPDIHTGFRRPYMIELYATGKFLEYGPHVVTTITDNWY